MFGIGWTEFIIIFLVLLIFVGPRHFPELLRRFGQIVGELRVASRELRNQLDVELKDVQSPSAAAKRVGRELLDSWDSPYGDDLSPKEGYAPSRLDQSGPPGEPEDKAAPDAPSPAGDEAGVSGATETRNGEVDLEGEGKVEGEGEGKVEDEGESS